MTGPVPPVQLPGLPRGVAGSRWADHLRSGGTTPWVPFRDAVLDGPDALPDERRPTPPPLPGAQQLELLRRLNEHAEQAGRPLPGGLAARVLGAGTTGRGRPDLDLAGDGRERPFGARPVDPALLPAEELLRVAVGLAADDLVGLARRAPGVAAPPRWPRRLPLRHRYRVVGDPGLAGPVREELARRHRPVGGRDARVLVLGASVERMLVHLWLHRAVTEGAPDWPSWLRSRVERGPVTPARLDLAAAAETWAGREGPHRVHVVLDPDALRPAGPHARPAAPRDAPRRRRRADPPGRRGARRDGAARRPRRPGGPRAPAAPGRRRRAASGPPRASRRAPRAGPTPGSTTARVWCAPPSPALVTVSTATPTSSRTGRGVLRPRRSRPSRSPWRRSRAAR